jgi:hypothetical protein
VSCSNCHKPGHNRRSCTVQQSTAEVLATVDKLVGELLTDNVIDSAMVPAVRILLVGLAIGAVEEKIAAATGLSLEDEVLPRADRLRANGVWCGFFTRCEWFDKRTGTLALVLDAGVADGWFTRSPTVDGEPLRFAAARDKPTHVRVATEEQVGRLDVAVDDPPTLTEEQVQRRAFIDRLEAL